MGNFSFKWPYYIDYTNDWLIHDFTLAEIKTLKRKQRFNFRNQMLNGIFDFMTLNETIDLMLKMQKESPNFFDVKNKKFPPGLYMETKHYQWYKDNYNLDFAQILHGHLKAYGLDTVEKATSKLPIVIECFEPDSLKNFSMLSDLPVVLLMDGDMQKYMKLDDIEKYAHGIGPWVHSLFDQNFLGEAQKR